VLPKTTTLLLAPLFVQTLQVVLSPLGNESTRLATPQTLQVYTLLPLLLTTGPIGRRLM